MNCFTMDNVNLNDEVNDLLFSTDDDSDSCGRRKKRSENIAIFEWT